MVVPPAHSDDPNLPGAGPGPGRPAGSGAVKPHGAPGQRRHCGVNNAFLSKNIDVRLFQRWVPHYQAFDVIGADGFGNFVPDISTGVN